MSDLFKESAKRQVDTQAENVRLLWITRGYGQAAVYVMKAEEARRFLASTPQQQQDEDWPFIDAELNITAPTRLGVAQTINAVASQWTLVAAMIETLRLPRKRAIDQCETEQQALDLSSGIDWPKPTS